MCAELAVFDHPSVPGADCDSWRLAVKLGNPAGHQTYDCVIVTDDSIRIHDYIGCHASGYCLLQFRARTHTSLAATTCLKIDQIPAQSSGAAMDL